MYLLCRGAPGRIMKLEDMQEVIDDFGLPLHLGSAEPIQKTVRVCMYVVSRYSIRISCSNTATVLQEMSYSLGRQTIRAITLQHSKKPLEELCNGRKPSTLVGQGQAQYHAQKCLCHMQMSPCCALLQQNHIKPQKNHMTLENHTFTRPSPHSSTVTSWHATCSCQETLISTSVRVCYESFS